MRGSTRFQCTAVAFSPFEERQIAVSSAQHFGIVGNGCQVRAARCGAARGACRRAAVP